MSADTEFYSTTIEKKKYVKYMRCSDKEVAYFPYFGTSAGGYHTSHCGSYTISPEHPTERWSDGFDYDQDGEAWMSQRTGSVFPLAKALFGPSKGEKWLYDSNGNRAAYQVYVDDSEYVVYAATYEEVNGGWSLTDEDGTVCFVIQEDGTLVDYREDDD